ncbi:MAG: hemerythrin domain-containing protein [Neomegalonema sp.]|nr:hemerythrin domain-containing protein [Neomegalonema sp.]
MPIETPDAQWAMDTRDGLPDAFRILLEKHPRASWDAPGAMGPLAAFWLERHLMFRQIIDRLISASESFIDRNCDPRTFAQMSAQLGQVLVGELHGHHHIEDIQYFPVLMSREPRLARAFGLLDADHHALDEALPRFVDASNGVLKARRDQALGVDVAASYLRTVSSFQGGLIRHLADEEDIVIPILIEHGQEWLG